MFSQEDIDRAVLAERDRCAKIAKDIEKKSRVISGFWNRDHGGFYQRGMREAAKDIRQAIRNPVTEPVPA
jgi:hypothetical protein